MLSLQLIVYRQHKDTIKNSNMNLSYIWYCNRIEKYNDWEKMEASLYNKGNCKILKNSHDTILYHVIKKGYIKILDYLLNESIHWKCVKNSDLSWDEYIY